MKIDRHFTTPGTDALDTAEYEKRSCAIRNPDGSAVFEMPDIEVPRHWSQLAGDILISKYIRKAGLPEAPGHETSVRQVLRRIARTIRHAGETLGAYFDAPADAEAFEQELTWLLLYQRAAFNSPVWFNCGLFHEYGISGGEGNWAWNPAAGRVVEQTNNYKHPQCSACFIQSVGDDLMSIFGLVKREARIFKYGSGTGTNFSNLRGRQEQLSGGGTSSGLMSFLEVFDRAAGATKSGGTTRRAAKMVCLDADHPEIRDFVAWKRKEEHKVRALIEAGYPADFNGEAYHTISGQNSNNSVRITDEFMQAYLAGNDWQTRKRTTGEVCETFPARDLMREICESAWECADPGVQFDTTINAWHTCPESGRIRASNPCSEYMFVDNSACNLSSINLLHYVREDGSFDLEAFRHTVRVLILAQEILVDFSSYPDEEIARNSHLFRPLGLGYANLGSLLMVQGLPYDSDAGRALAAVLTAILTGAAYRVSAEIAATKQPFEEFGRNREAMLRVIGQHRDAVDHIASPEACPAELLAAAHTEWNEALAAGERWGFRNAQVTVLAPTGTIGLLMDCDTTGVEPDYSLVKFKKLSGGGYFKIVNQSVRLALLRLGYGEGQAREILDYVLGTRSLAGTPQVTAAELRKRGLTAEEVARVEKVLHGAFDFESAFAPHVVGNEALERLGVGAEDSARPDFSLLETLGFSREAIAEAAHTACGSMTIEGAPHLAPEHYPVFDCANKCGPAGTRFIQPMGHVRMMAAVQPFLSGAISKTVNLGATTTVEQIEAIYRSAWEMGLKAVALYRDGCKSSQPLSSGPRKRKDAAAAAPAPAAPRAQLDLFPELAEPHRRRLPQRRGGITVEARVAGHKVFLRTGEYENGDLGEVFIDMHKEGSSFRSLIMCFAIAVSKGLQYGVPLREFVDTFTFTNFEPRGVCDHPNIKMVTSVIDYVFRVLGMEYLGRTDFCQIKPEATEKVPPADRLVGRGTPPSPRRRAETPAGTAASAAAGGAGDPAGNGGTHPDLEELKLDEEAQQAGETEARQGAEGGATGAAGAAGAVAGMVAGTGAAGARTDARPASGGAAADARHAAVAASPVDQQLAEFMSDSPFCDICGHITVRSGACYKCLNCGHSMGCS